MEIILSCGIPHTKQSNYEHYGYELAFHTLGHACRPLTSENMIPDCFDHRAAANPRTSGLGRIVEIQSASRWIQAVEGTVGCLDGALIRGLIDLSIGHNRKSQRLVHDARNRVGKLWMIDPV